MNKALKVIVLSLALFMLGVGTATGVNYMYKASVDNPIVERSCIIRFDGSKPRIHVNTAHVCIGINSVSVLSNGDMKLVGDNVGSVSFLAVEEDETITAKGLLCGGSGGGTNIIIRCFSRAGNKVHMGGPTMRHPYSNLWIKTSNWIG